MTDYSASIGQGEEDTAADIDETYGVNVEFDRYSVAFLCECSKLFNDLL